MRHSRPSRAVTAKICGKICAEKRDERAELFFCQSKVAVLVDVAVVVA